MRVMVIVKASKESESGGVPDEKTLREMGNFNAGAGEGRGDARGRGPPAELDRQADEVFLRQADGPRRAL